MTGHCRNDRVSRTLAIRPAKDQDYVRTVAERLDRFYGPPSGQGFLKSVAHDPLDTLIKTVLSQATNDYNSEQAFANLKSAYPSWKEVAEAPESRIAELIKIGGLGPQKARRIKTILKSVRDTAGEYNLSFLASMPDEEAWNYLTGLQGVGPKTAACTLLFAFGRPFFPVDTHIHRIARRLGIALPKDSAEKVQQKMQSLVPPELVESSHVNMIRLGREICGAKKPRCHICPLVDLCDHYSKAGRFPQTPAMCRPE